MTTKRVTNQESLRAVFRGVGGDSFLWVASFRGDPKSASSQKWTGKPYRINSPLTVDEGGNTFFNIATVREHGGTVARKEGNFDALHVVVLDDIGTKAALPEGVEPSYLLETSEGNFQAGFILDPPCEDLARAKALFKALADQGLTDKGAQGPQSRYVRLPVGINHKSKCGPNGFAHRLALWVPERRFTVEGLCELLGLTLDIEPAATAKPVIRTATDDRTDKADGVVIAIVLRSDKGRRVWAGDDTGFGSGSDADQYLLNLIAFSTESAEQVERIYSQSPRASRKSADGTCKWAKRADYRKRSIEAAFRFVEKHPHGDTESARATVETAVAVAKASDDARGIYAPDVIESLAVLRRGDVANYEHYRKQAKKAGVNLTALIVSSDSMRFQ